MQPFTGSPVDAATISIPDLQLPPFLVWIFLGIGLCVFIFQTAIVAYHWYMYAPSIGLRRKMLVVHGIVSGAMIFLSLFGAFIITLMRQ